MYSYEHAELLLLE